MLDSPARGEASVCSWAQRRSDTPKVIHRRVYERERVLDSLAKRSSTGGGNQSWPVTLGNTLSPSRSSNEPPQTQCSLCAPRSAA
jgi:hypothetical protein